MADPTPVPNLPPPGGGGSSKGPPGAYTDSRGQRWIWDETAGQYNRAPGGGEGKAPVFHAATRTRAAYYTMPDGSTAGARVLSDGTTEPDTGGSGTPYFLAAPDTPYDISTAPSGGNAAAADVTAGGTGRGGGMTAYQQAALDRQGQLDQRTLAQQRIQDAIGQLSVLAKLNDTANTDAASARDYTAKVLPDLVPSGQQYFTAGSPGTYENRMGIASAIPNTHVPYTPNAARNPYAQQIADALAKLQALGS